MHKQVVGLLTVDKVLEQVKQDSFKQALSQVGLSEDEDLFAPIWQSGRKRLAWLGLNLLTAFVASRVVGGFEGSIAQLTALAALMPIVASIGGNTGNQTVALVIRGLALSQLNARNMLFLLRKELAIGVINGVLWGIVMAAATLVLYRSPGLAAVMASCDGAEHVVGVGGRRAVPDDLAADRARPRHGQQHPADGVHRQHGVLYLPGARVALAPVDGRAYDGNSTPEPPADFGRSLCFASESTMRSTAS